VIAHDLDFAGAFVDLDLDDVAAVPPSNVLP
jgi:hypothetical protein